MGKKNIDKIDGKFVTHSGNFVKKNGLKVKDGKVEFNEGSYIVDTDCLLLEKKIFNKKETYVWIEGIPDPVNFSKLPDPKLKLGAKNLKDLLNTKLFESLFKDPKQEMKELIFNALAIIQVILMIIQLIALFGLTTALKDAGIIS